MLFRSKNLNVSMIYDLSDVDVLLNNFSIRIRDLIESKLSILSTLKSEERKHDREAVENHLSRLYRLSHHCTQYKYLKDRALIGMTNNPIAFVEGEAGSGKSHLLGDIASTINSEGHPVILLLGREFSPALTIDQNIIAQLGLSCTFDELLVSMNRIGTERDCRFMILVDAINETDGRHYWRDRLAGFVEKIKAFPAVGIVMTIRSSYLNECLPKQMLLKDRTVHLIKHMGFKGREHEVIPVFCEYYKISAPTMPLLNPEYANPLLLTISCQVAQKSIEKKFIMANYGMSGLFEKYRQQMDENFNDKRDGIYNGLRIVTKSINAIVPYMYENSLHRLSFDDCYKLLSEKIGPYPYLLNDLIAESLLIKEMGYGDEETYVRFSYQRLSDYYMADKLLEGKDAEGVQEMFRAAGFINMLKNNANCSGVIEQFAVLLPERFDLEVFELLDLESVDLYDSAGEVIMSSLRWRSYSHVNAGKIISFLEDKKVGYFQWLNTCMLLAPIPNHPFNSDYFTHIMKQYDLKNREAVLQPYIIDYYLTDEDYTDQHIKNLLNWCWSDNVSSMIDHETARLAGQQMAWLLCSTINSLRDRATKAMVNLLRSQPEALLCIMKAFEDIDDIYIQERLYAVAYGCVLRMESMDGVRNIGNYVYETIFKDGNPPLHILWRDYACNTVDYAVRIAGLQNVDMKLVLPPYNSMMPILPTQKDIEKYKLPYDNNNIAYVHEQNSIFNSLVDGLADFGTKILDGKVRDFKGWSFRLEDEYKAIKKSLRGKKRELIETYESLYCRYLQMQENRGRLRSSCFDDEFRAKLEQLLVGQLPTFYTYIESQLGNDVAKRLQDVLIPNHRKKLMPDYRNEINPWPIRCWVVQRVFDLGYDKDLHGEYDRRAKTMEGFSRHPDANVGKVERIGKKYEWIGLYEILGCLADNYEIECPWDTSLSKRYEGAWLHYMRDIDPVRITKFSDNDIDDSADSTWHDYDSYSLWNLDGNAWLHTTADLVDLKEYLQRTDENGRVWLTIHDYRMCKEPRKLGDDKWQCSRYHNIRINSFIIKAADKQKLIKKSEGANFRDLSYLEPYDSHTYHIAREKFWSRGSREETSFHKNSWEELFTESGVKAKVICEQYAGDIEDDHSGTRGQCYMPTYEIFDLLGLKYGASDGDFIDGNNNLVGTCNPNRPIHFLLSKEELLNAIRDKGLDLVWIVSMERMFCHGGQWMNSSITYPNGLFYLDEDMDIQGGIQIHKRKW